MDDKDQSGDTQVVVVDLSNPARAAGQRDARAPGLVVLDLDDANAEPVVLDGTSLGQWWWIVSVIGERAISQGGYGQLSLIDAGVASQTEIRESSIPGWGGCYQPVIDGDTVYCPMGPYGLETVGW